MTLSAMMRTFFHAVPRFRGRGRLICYSNRVLLHRTTSPLVTAKMRLGHSLILDLRSATEYPAFYTGEYDDSRLKAVCGLFEDGAVVADVGANIGFYSVPFAREVENKGGKVLSFEPVPSNYARLQSNIELNRLGAVVQLFPFALSESSGEAEITLREDFQRGGETGNAAILIPDGQDVRFNSVKVPLRTMDWFCEEAGLTRLDFIKVDIEGHEDAFFRGAAGVISRFRPIILAEMNEDFFRRKGVDMDAEVRSEFIRLRYVFLAQRRGRWTRVESLKGRGVADDILLVPEEKLERVNQVFSGL